ncbi:MAG: hypothetical protein ACXVA9_00920 [Bdellovibrionales bacterium]
MKAGRIFVALLTVFAVGFGVYSRENSALKQSEELKREGNRLIIQSENGKKELNDRYGITLTPLVETVPGTTRAREFDWSKFTPAQRKLILKKLFAHSQLIGRIFEIARADGMRMDGGAGNLKKSGDTAWLFYLSGKDYQSKFLAVK